jgi:L,D-peptidoglycan transpeptidase YkuD (ErfK/YbiS/YcfS/YnhG family)
MCVHVASVILSGVRRARSARRTQSKDPDTLEATQTIRPFLTTGRPGARLALLTCFSLLLVSADAHPRRISTIAKADRVLVLKHQHILQLTHNGQVVKAYKVALGGSPVGPKTQQGDHKTPEGVYVLDSRNSRSQFYKSLHISYPNATQRAAAKKRGVSPGGDVFVHGLPPRYRSVGAAHRLYDWTDGCIAVTDGEMDEIWLAVADGTPIEIRP